MMLKIPRFIGVPLFITQTNHYQAVIVQ